jgi:putative spermidine/putrescine transport system ATP-binding protein
MIAGFETPTSGRIAIGGRDVTDLRPNQRKIGMVFQSYALFPNLTVAQNIGFGMKVVGASRADIDARVGEMLEIIKLPQHGKRYPFQLSGGQQQRVALARALAVQPQVLLLDEPLSALDAKIRISLREEIRSIQRKLGITTIYVTHDQEEALSMSDRIVVMHEGVAEQVGTPFEIYNRPATRFVASFVGTLNVLRATVLDPQAGRVRIGDRELRLGRQLPASQGQEIALSLRPEVISLGSHPGRPLELPGRVAEVSFLGSVIRVRVQVGDFHLSLDTFNNPAVAPPRLGEERVVSFSPEDVLVIPS